MFNVYFQFFGLFDIVLLAIVYFSKKIFKTEENKVYSMLIILNFIGQILHILSYVTIYNMENIPILNFITTKGYLVYLEIWVSLFFTYICAVTYRNVNIDKYKNKLKNIFRIMTVIDIIIFIAIIYLPIYYYKNENLIYTYGASVDLIYIISIIYITLSVLLFIRYYKKIKEYGLKKYIPLFVFIIIGSAVMVIQYTNPSLLLITTCETFITLMMYFTIENPDMKMLREIQKSKEYAEQANTEKAMFLYNTSQELKTPVKSIQDRCEELLQEQDINEIINGIKDIKFAAKRLSSTISGTLDMNKMQATNIEIKVSRYSTKMLFQEMVSITKLNMKEKSLEFRVNLDDNIPEYLMGDSIRIKQIIQTIMNNAIKHTEKGFIEFNVSSVIKHDVCRLIITIEDSGSGMESKKLETLFYNTEDEEVLDEERLNNVQETKERLSVVKILTNLIGGTVIVNSELGKGTKFTVVLDQNIAEIKKTGTEIAIEKLSSNKRILVVDDEEESIKQITKVLNKYEVNVETAMWGQECLERIRKKQSYDLILLDEDMPRLNGIKTFEKLKIEENFNIPVVIMINSNHIDYKERYMYNGFSGCIVKPIKKTDIDKFIKKYIKEDE